MIPAIKMIRLRISTHEKLIKLKEKMEDKFDRNIGLDELIRILINNFELDQIV